MNEYTNNQEKKKQRRKINDEVYTLTYLCNWKEESWEKSTGFKNFLTYFLYCMNM